MSVVSNVLLKVENNSLFIRATDIKINFETTVPVNVVEEGSTTVLCVKLFSIINLLPDGEIEFSLQNQTLIVKPLSKKMTHKFKTIAADQFPEERSRSDLKFFDIQSKEFKEVITQTIFAVSDDETRYFMNGIYMEKEENSINFVATDGRRLAFVKKAVENAPDFKPVIIPTKLLSIVQRYSGDEGLVSIALTDDLFFVNIGQYQFSTVLIEGNFPNYKRVIPENQVNKVVADKETVIKAIRRAYLYVNENTNRIYFKLHENTMTVFTEENDIGNAEEDVECEYAGEEAVISLKYAYIEEPLRVLEEDEMIIEFTDTKRAITLKPVPEHDYFHIIMPMQTDY
jgi:DNA polymerase-3 subunit beta